MLFVNYDNYWFVEGKVKFKELTAKLNTITLLDNVNDTVEGIITFNLLESDLTKILSPNFLIDIFIPSLQNVFTLLCSSGRFYYDEENSLVSLIMSVKTITHSLEGQIEFINLSKLSDSMRIFKDVLCMWEVVKEEVAKESDKINKDADKIEKVIELLNNHELCENKIFERAGVDVKETPEANVERLIDFFALHRDIYSDAINILEEV